MRFRAGLWALALTVHVGCATVPACPAKGGPTWRELTSDHFVVRTDIDEADALVVLRRLEDARAAMLAVVWPRAPELPGRIEGFALASRGEVAAYLGTQFAAVHIRSPPFPPMMLLFGPADSAVDANHELAHALSLQLMPLQPPWLAEGLADYLSTVHRDEEQEGRVVIGDAVVNRYQYFQRFGPCSLHTLLGPVPETTFEQGQFYATSWMLVHYLFNVRPIQLERFVKRLQALEPATKTFAAEFPDLAKGGLEAVLRDYAFSGKYTARTRAVAPWSGEHQTRVLPDADVHASRAILASSIHSGSEWRTAARSDVAEALQDPRPPIEAFVLPFLSSQLAPPGLARDELVRRAVVARPESWMSWWMAATVAPSGSPERRGALLRARDLNPYAIEVLLLQAFELARAQRWRETLHITNDLLPDGALDHDVWLLHLQALLHLGYCPEAQLWGTALEGYLNAKEAALAATIRAQQACGPAVTAAPAPASQAARPHARE